jgi:hypothetical protein
MHGQHGDILHGRLHTVSTHAGSYGPIGHILPTEQLNVQIQDRRTLSRRPPWGCDVFLLPHTLHKEPIPTIEHMRLPANIC